MQINFFYLILFNKSNCAQINLKILLTANKKRMRAKAKLKYFLFFS